MAIQTNTYFMTSKRIGFSLWTEKDLALAQALWGNPDVSRYITAVGVEYYPPTGLMHPSYLLEKEGNSH